MKISDVVVGQEYYRVVHVRRVTRTSVCDGFPACYPLQRVRVIEKVKRRFIVEIPVWKCERSKGNMWDVTWRRTTSKVETFASKLRELT